MKKKYQNYINIDHSFDNLTMLGIFCLIIVIAGTFGFLYEYIFYFFNGGMKEFYWRGGNFLPWINIYATGSIMIYFLASILLIVMIALCVKLIHTLTKVDKVIDDITVKSSKLDNLFNVIDTTADAVNSVSNSIVGWVTTTINRLLNK